MIQPTKRMISKILAAGAAVAVLGLGNVANAGKIYVSGQDSDDAGHVTVAFGTQLLNFINTGNTNGGSGILILGGDTSGDSRTTINSWNPSGITFTLAQAADETAIAAANFSAFAGILIPSSVNQTGGGISQFELNAIIARSAAIAAFVNGGGNLMAFTETGLSGAFGWFPLGALSISNVDYAGLFSPVLQTPDLAAAGFIATNAELSGDLYHNVFTGPPGFFGLKVLATDNTPGLGFGQAAILGGGTTTQICAEPPCPGPVGVVPEPGVLPLLALGLLGFLGIARRKPR